MDLGKKLVNNSLSVSHETPPKYPETPKGCVAKPSRNECIQIQLMLSFLGALVISLGLTFSCTSSVIIPYTSDVSLVHLMMYALYTDALCPISDSLYSAPLILS